MPEYSRDVRSGGVGVAFATIAIISDKEHPMALTFYMHQGCLDNVEDPAGIFQIEGGRLTDEKEQPVGTYSIVRRTSCGTQQFNTAMYWLTLFLTKGWDNGKPPQNLTLHGAHDYDSGDAIGSVSAASSAFATEIGKQFQAVPGKVSIL